MCRPADTLDAFDNDGWFKTGDIAQRDESGNYMILGRNSSDIIKSGGYKLSSLEIEREILSHPKVWFAQRCCFFLSCKSSYCLTKGTRDLCHWCTRYGIWGGCSSNY